MKLHYIVSMSLNFFNYAESLCKTINIIFFTSLGAICFSKCLFWGETYT